MGAKGPSIHRLVNARLHVASRLVDVLNWHGIRYYVICVFMKFGVMAMMSIGAPLASIAETFEYDVLRN